jgi:hypothetical protein
MLESSSSKPLSSMAEADKRNLLPSVGRDETFSVVDFQHAASSFFLKKTLSACAWELAGLVYPLVVSRFSGLTHQSLRYAAFSVASGIIEVIAPDSRLSECETCFKY